MLINAKSSFAFLSVPDVMIRIFPNNHTGKYLSNLYGIVQLVIKRFGRFMVKDLTGTISALRCAAVGRCRERLEQAAQKAKGIINNGQTPERREISLTYKEQYGVTSVMKRKHGL